MTEWDHEVDVVCVGSGIGGCATAATAAHFGARVLIVEKTDKLGGVTAYSAGQTWLPASRQSAELGIDDTVDEAIHYLEALGSAEWGDPALTRNVFTRANEALEFFEDTFGLRMRVIRGLSDYFYSRLDHALPEGRYLEPEPFDMRSLGELNDKVRRSPTPLSGGGLAPDGDPDDVGQYFVGMGEALAASFIAAAVHAGVELWTNSPVTDLITDAGRVIGVSVRRSNGGEIKVGARRGVVLATGGYDWNPELVNRFEGVFDPHSSASPPGIDGDHLAFGARIGAAITRLPPQRNVMSLGYPTDLIDDDGHRRHVAYNSTGPHEIFVNRSGKRFADESFYPALATALQNLDGHTHTYANWPVWHIMDQNFFDKGMGATMGPPDSVTETADTLEELAAKVGIDPDGLVDTVRRYNELCAAGRDTDFGRGEMPWVRKTFRREVEPGAPNASLGPIERAPFYAATLARVQVGIPSAGLQIDASGRVVAEAGAPIDGLYAVGNAAGRNDLGVALQSGLANTRGLVYGFLVGRDVSGAEAAD